VASIVAALKGKLRLAAAADNGEEGGEPSESTEMSQLLPAVSTRANSWLIVTSSLVFRGFDMVGVEERG